MSRKVSPSAKRSYGVQRVTRVWGISPATLYRHRWCDAPRPRRRPGPIGPMPDAALVEAIRGLLASSPFHGEGYRKIRARLRFAGIRTSKHRVLRLMREHDLLAPGRVGLRHGPKAPTTARSEPSGSTRCGAPISTATLTGEGQTGGLRHRRPRLDRVPGHPRRQTGDAVRGARAAPPGCAHLVQCLRRGHRARPASCATTTAASSSPTTSSASSPSSTSRSSPCSLRARARGQRLRRALHPDPAGILALGASLQLH